MVKRPSADVIGWAAASDRSMIDNRRWASPTPLVTHFVGVAQEGLAIGACEVADAEYRTHGGCDPDRRCAAHAECRDRLSHRRGFTALEHDQLTG